MYSAVDFESETTSSSELSPQLLADVPKEISWASEALGQSFRLVARERLIGLD
jgi:hypothetical protein